MAHADLAGLVADSWREGGARLRPGDLADWTPHQLLAVFFTRPAAGGKGQSNLDILARHNRDRAANGVRPVAPSWFLADLRGG